MAGNVITDLSRVTNGVVVTSSSNTNSWYTREIDGTFSINGSFSQLYQSLDWIGIKDFDSKFIKSGIVTNCQGKPFQTIYFKTPFKNNNYYVFFSTNINVNIYWNTKKPTSFVVMSSSILGSEISWIAIHKDFAITTGIRNFATIFCGSRTITHKQQTNLTNISINDELNINSISHTNLNGWHNNEYIIMPDVTIDGFFYPMNLVDYITILSTNNNVNLFYIKKIEDRVKIGTSYPVQNCVVDYLIIKKGLNWIDNI